MNADHSKIFTPVSRGRYRIALKNSEAKETFKISCKYVVKPLAVPVPVH
jgi:hypothetical protein